MSTKDYTQLRLLAVFATVVEAGSFAAAARKLNTSRSRVSEQVAALESGLGIRLLQRSTRQLTVTPEGLGVFEQARQLPEILEAVEAIVMPAEPSGRVAITMNHDIAHKYVLPVLAEFKRRYPKVQLDLILDDASLDLIGEQIDLGIRIGIPRDESLVGRVMHEEKMSLFASPGHLKQYGTPRSLDDLAQSPWVTLIQSSFGDIQRLQDGGKTVEIEPSESYRCNSPFMVQKMVEEGLGVGLLLPGTVRREVQRGTLLPIMSSLSSPPMVFSLVYPSRRQLPLRTRVLIDFLLESRVFDADPSEA